MSKIKCQNPECKKSFKGRNSKNRVSRFCSVKCSARHRKLFPDQYQNLKNFKKGQIAWNKGRRSVKVGDTITRKKITKAGIRRDLKYACIGYDDNGKPKHIRNDRYIWLINRGPLPKGHTIWHKDGRTLNDDIENLEVIPIGEALSRYALEKKKILDLTNPKHILKIKEGCIRGDIRIQKTLYDMMYSKCKGLAIKYSKSKADAEEIVSDSFIKIFNNIHKVEPTKGGLGAWMCKIVVNTAIDAHRRVSGKNNITDSIHDYGDGKINHTYNKLSVKADHGSGVDYDRIMDMINDLSPSYRAVFNLKVMEGLSHVEISERLNISEGACKSNLSKAKRILREKLISIDYNGDLYEKNLIEYNEELTSELI